MNSLASLCNDGDLRLVNYGMVDPAEGRVEVCVNGIWGSVCNKGFNSGEATVICRQLLGDDSAGIYYNNLLE